MDMVETKPLGMKSVLSKFRINIQPVVLGDSHVLFLDLPILNDALYLLDVIKVQPRGDVAKHIIPNSSGDFDIFEQAL